MVSFWRKKRLREAHKRKDSPATEPMRPERLVIAFVFVVVMLFLLGQPLVSTSILLSPGDIAEFDIHAPPGFVFKDVVRARMDREAAMRRYPTVVTVDPESMAEDGDYILGVLDGADTPAGLSASAIALLSDRSKTRHARSVVSSALRRLREAGLLERDPEPGESFVIMHEGETEVIPPGVLLGPSDFSDLLRDYGADEDEAAALADLLDAALRPNVRIDQDALLALSLRVEEEVPVPSVVFPAGAPVITAGRQISERDAEILVQMNDFKARRSILALASLLGYIIILISISSIYIKRNLPRVWGRSRHLAAVAAVGLIITLLSRLVHDALPIFKVGDLELSNAALPLAATASILAVFFGSRVAFISSALIAFSVGATLAFRADLIVVFVISSLVAALASAKARRRSDLGRAALWVAAVQTGTLTLLSLIHSTGGNGIVADLASSAIGGLLISPITLAAIPIIEWISRKTTSFRLLELADLNNEVLRRMLREAPGTYQHSNHVALLAEAAAENIGADSLLTRVGAFYHDIGKLRHPEYFTENTGLGFNPHDTLKPSLSASVLKAHIQDGLALAEEFGLPEEVAAFIPEHQGTMLMEFFYDKAIQTNGEAGVDKSDYIYDGPRPTSAETAIVMLADGVEAASRSLKKPTTIKLERTVRKIIDARYRDGELDDCPLTFRDLGVITETFKRVLTGMYHVRGVEYPDREEEPERDNGNQKNGNP